MKLYVWLLFIGLAIFSNKLSAQCSVTTPPNAVNLCLQTQTALSNTASSITVTNPSRLPPAGPYTVTLNYFSRTTGRCVNPINCPAATVTLSGNSFTVNLGGCTSLPANFSTAPTLMFCLVSQAGGGTYFVQHLVGDCGLPLPITIASFTAQRVGNTIQLDWTTAEEIDASHIVIERNILSGSPVTPMEIGSLPAIHPNGGSYTFTDQYPLDGTNTYRLRLVDLNGTYKYSNPVSVGCGGCTATPPLLDCSNISISGPGSVCPNNMGYFSVTNPIYYSTYTWWLNDNYGGLSNNDGTFTYASAMNTGATQLNLQVSRCTDATKNKIKSVEFVKKASGFYMYTFGGGIWNLTDADNGTNYVNPGDYTIGIEKPQFATFTWSFLDGFIASWSYDAFTKRMRVVLPPEGYAYFHLATTTPCGTITQYFNFETFGLSSLYTVSPNPASAELKVSVDNRNLEQLNRKPSSGHTIQQVTVHDKTGTVVWQQKYAVNTKAVSINVASLKPDVYTVRIFNGKKWEAKKFVKQ